MGRRRKQPRPAPAPVTSKWVKVASAASTSFEAPKVVQSGLTASEELALNRALGEDEDSDENLAQNCDENRDGNVAKDDNEAYEDDREDEEDESDDGEVDGDVDRDEDGDDREDNMKDDDELRSVDRDAIDEFVGDTQKDEDADIPDDESETLASAAAAFLARAQPVSLKQERKTERRKRQRERAKEKAAEVRRESTHAATAYVRFFGNKLTKENLDSFFADKCADAKVRIVEESNAAKAAFVQVPKAEDLSLILGCDGAKLGGTKLSVKPALTKSGIQAFVDKKKDPTTKKKKEKKKLKKRERRQTSDDSKLALDAKRQRRGIGKERHSNHEPEVLELQDGVALDAQKLTTQMRKSTARHAKLQQRRAKKKRKGSSSP